MNVLDTICAIATPVGSSGIGVIRISGSDAIGVSSLVIKHKKQLSSNLKSKLLFDLNPAKSHTAYYVSIFDPNTKEIIDKAVITIFRNPKSYTGEDVVEISCHGGIAVLKAVLNVVIKAGARLAEPGEFTKRAFLNGKLDLAQAEAVNDIIRAGAQSARKVALRQLSGELSNRIKEINRKVLGVIAAVEAAIDFPDDVAEPESEWLNLQISECENSVELLLENAEKGRVFREGLRIALVGNVNVGKSSLLNALLKHARAIVTPIPGTTRDAIEESLQIEGIPIVVVDTAGIRDTSDPVEMIGVKRTWDNFESADVIIVVIDINEGINDADIEIVKRAGSRPAIAVLNKMDLLSENAQDAVEMHLYKKLGESFLVVKTCASLGQGIDLLEKKIAELAVSGDCNTESILVSNARHRRALELASESLKQALISLKRNEPIDFLSVDLISARNNLGLITGETASEDLLDVIFGEFCIGK